MSDILCCHEVLRAASTPCNWNESDKTRSGRQVVGKVVELV